MARNINYVILPIKAINALDFSKRRGKDKIYLAASKEHIRYNTNKFFFQRKKGVIKFRGKAPSEIEGYKKYNQSEILKIVRSSWGQWKLN